MGLPLSLRLLGLSLFLHFYPVTSSENALLILGGASKIFLSQYGQSPVLTNFELFGCSDVVAQLPPYPVEVFGPSMVWDGDEGQERLWVCGGATFQTSLSDCYTWDPRVPGEWTKQASIRNKRAFAILAFLPDENDDTKLFLIGGLDPITYTHVLSVEVYDNDVGVWKAYRDLPGSEGIYFPTSPDSGCLSVLTGRVFTIGDEVSALDWKTWELVRIGGSEGNGVGSKCSLVRRENGEEGFFFLSGDWFSLKTESWSKFTNTFSAFNLVSFNKKPTILGLAHQNGSCGQAGCDGNTLYGDTALLQHDGEADKWTQVGKMAQERLVFAAALEVPGSICAKLDMSSEADSVEPKMNVEVEQDLDSQSELDSESSDTKTNIEQKSTPVKIKDTTKRPTTTTKRTATTKRTTTTIRTTTTTATTTTPRAMITKAQSFTLLLEPKSTAIRCDAEFVSVLVIIICHYTLQ